MSFSPSEGYTASGDISVGTENSTDLSVQVNSSYNLGATFGVYISELDSIEASFQRQFADGRIPTEITDPPCRVNLANFSLKIDRYHVNFLHHFTVGNPDAKPYVSAGLGWKTYRGQSAGVSHSKSFFSFALGGGIKYFLTDYFGFRGEARWSPSVLNASGSSFWCEIGVQGAECLIKLKASLHHQMDLNGGLVFRF